MAPVELPRDMNEPGVDPASSHSLGSDGKTDHEILVLQRKEYSYLAERPTDWLGGAGEEAETCTHLPHPKPKLKTSWQHGKATNDQTDGNVEEKAPATTSPSAKVLEKHSRVADHSQKSKPKNAKQEDTLSDKRSQAKDDNMQESKLSNSDHEVLVFQKKENQYLTERPGDWLTGGEREDPLEKCSSHHHATKLKKTWIHNEGMSQSLHDLSTDPLVNKSDDGPFHSSEPRIFMGKERRQTSPKILQKLSALNQKNEENHKANDDLGRIQVHRDDACQVVKDARAAKAAWISGEARMSQSLRDLSTEGKDVDMHGQASPKVTEKLMDIKKKNEEFEKGSGSNHSLRDMLAGPGGKVEIKGFVNPTGSPTGQRRKTSPMILAKLTGLSQLNEEIHKKNEELAVHHKVAHTSKAH